jgi:hypothetical protein
MIYIGFDTAAHSRLSRKKIFSALPAMQWLGLANARRLMIETHEK